MTAAVRPLRLRALLVVATTFVALPAAATPLGLSPDDVVNSVSWNALQPTSGGDWDVVTGVFHADGDVNSVTVNGSSVIGQSGVTLRFDLGLLSHGIFINFGTNQAFANATLGGATSITPDFEVFQGANLILRGNILTGFPVQIEGNIDLSSGTGTLLGSGRIKITGGDPDLVDALGGIGLNGVAQLEISMAAFDFLPLLSNLASDGNVWNTSFTVSLSGTVAPLNPAPFVPEPATAMLLGGGFLGLLGLARRVRSRRWTDTE